MACTIAARYGKLETLKWLLKNNCDWRSRAISNAALNGHWDVLKWIKDEFNFWLPPVQLDKLGVISMAGNSGNIELLEWLLDSGCSPKSEILDYATRAGHLNVLKWYDQKFHIPEVRIFFPFFLKNLFSEISC
jgi:ankyrin repeat protein